MTSNGLFRDFPVAIQHGKAALSLLFLCIMSLSTLIAYVEIKHYYVSSDS